MRARIRKDMTRREGLGGRRLGQRVAGDSGAGSDPDCGGAEPGAAAAAGQDAVRSGGAVAEDAIEALCDMLIKDKAFTEVAVFGMDEPDVVLALKQPWVSVDNDSSGTRRMGSGQGASAPAGVWHVSANFAEVCARGKGLTLADAIRKFSRAAGATDAADRSRRAEAGHVGGCGGV